MFLFHYTDVETFARYSNLAVVEFAVRKFAYQSTEPECLVKWKASSKSFINVYGPYNTTIFFSLTTPTPDSHTSEVTAMRIQA